MAATREGTQGWTICEGVRWATEPASSQCNVRPCETRYSTTGPWTGECGQILETLKGQPPSNRKLQIRTLVVFVPKPHLNTASEIIQ